MKFETMAAKIRKIQAARHAGTATCETLIGDGRDNRLCGAPACGHHGHGMAMGHLREIGGAGALCREHMDGLIRSAGGLLAANEGPAFAHIW